MKTNQLQLAESILKKQVITQEDFEYFKIVDFGYYCIVRSVLANIILQNDIQYYLQYLLKMYISLEKNKTTYEI